MISPELIQAYRETDYIVLPGRDAADTQFVLHIDLPSPPLMSLYQRQGVRCAAFITAFNPHSQQVASQQNDNKQKQLQAWLDREKYIYRSSIGRHPDGIWSGEPSFLILDLQLEAARSLGRRFGQNAIVWCDGDAVAQLVLLA